MGVSVLRPEWIIPFKAKAWLDLTEKKSEDSSDVKKHRNDIIRIASEMALQMCQLPEEVYRDLETFMEKLVITDSELKNLKLRGVRPEDIIETRKKT